MNSCFIHKNSLQRNLLWPNWVDDEGRNATCGPKVVVLGLFYLDFGL